MYTVLPIVPLVTVVLAWVDMDLTRQKEGPAPFANAGVRAGPASPPVRTPLSVAQPGAGRAAPYANGYTGVPRVADVAAAAKPGGFRFPFPDRRKEEAQPRDAAGARTLLLDPEKLAPVE